MLRPKSTSAHFLFRDQRSNRQFWFGAVLFAGALVVHSLLGWEVMNVVILISLVAAVVTILGGFAAVAYTDTIQTVIMILGCTLMLFLGLDKVGGWDELMIKAGSQMHVAGPIDDPSYPFWGIIVGVVYGGLFYWGMDQVNVQRVLGARDLQHARWGAMFAGLLKLTPIFIFALPGVITFALYPGLSDQDSRSTFVVMLNNLLPSGIRGLVLSALLAALISSILAVMNSVSTMLVRDFILYMRPGLSERVQVILGRLMVFVAAMAGALEHMSFRRLRTGFTSISRRYHSTCACRWCPPSFLGLSTDGST